MKILSKLTVMAALCIGPAAASAADLPLPPEITQSVMQACRPDYHRICGEVLPGEGRVGRCLQDHEEDLSPACLKEVKFAYAIEACSEDYHRYCQGVPAAGGRIIQCLSERSYSLAPACRRIVQANAPYFGGERRADEYHDRPYRDDRYAEGRVPERDDYRRPRDDRYAEGYRPDEHAYGVQPDDRYRGGDRYKEFEDGEDGDYRR